jgi:bidirectional [NiFe] hydrogenase diaphorase subunit
MLPFYDKCDPPSDDKRWKIVATTMKKLGNERSALIEALHSLQQYFGFLDKPGLTYIATTLRLPLSQVYGAATFYNHFSLKPQGKHACVVCTGTACFIKGAPELQKAVTRAYEIEPGETTADGEMSLMTARCFGACGLAPVAVVDSETMGRITPAILMERLHQITGDAHQQPAVSATPEVQHVG